jgi:hypothetical protein
MLTYIRRYLSSISNNYITKLLTIAVLSIITAYYLPDLTAWLIQNNMPDYPGIKKPQELLFYDQIHQLSMGLIFIFSCWISFYGIYKLIRYTILQERDGKKKLILVLVTYIYMIIGFANTYFLITYLADGYDSLHKFNDYYNLSLDKETKEYMIQKDLRIPNSNALSGIPHKLWSGVDTKEQLQLWNSEPFYKLPEPLPVSAIFKGVEYTQHQVIRYLPNNKPFVYADCLYFSTITIASVGYGDIIPLSALAKLLVCLETTMGQLLLALGIASAYSEVSTIRKNNRVVYQGARFRKNKSST